MVFYKLYQNSEKRPDALSICTGDASFLHFPQPTNEQESLFYYDLINPSVNHDSYTSSSSAIWLDISEANSWSSWVENFSTDSIHYYTTMIFKTGERDKNWNRVSTSNVYYFVCTAVFK